MTFAFQPLVIPNPNPVDWFPCIVIIPLFLKVYDMLASFVGPSSVKIIATCLFPWPVIVPSFIPSADTRVYGLHGAPGQLKLVLSSDWTSIPPVLSAYKFIALFVLLLTFIVTSLSMVYSPWVPYSAIAWAEP